MKFGGKKSFVIKGKTGCKKTLIYEVIQHLFGLDISSLRIMNNVYEKDMETFCQLEFTVDKVPWILSRIDVGDDSKWIAKHGISGDSKGMNDKVLLNKFLKEINVDPFFIESCFISETSSLYDITSFNRFMQSISPSYSKNYNYNNILSNLDRNYKNLVDEKIKKRNEIGEKKKLKKKVAKLIYEISKIDDGIDQIENLIDENNTDIITFNEQIKEVTELSIKLGGLKSKEESFKELVSIKENNINECAEQLSAYKGDELSGDLKSCARKTEVNLEKELKELEAEIQTLSEKIGNVELSLSSKKAQLELMTSNKEENDEKIEKEMLKLLSIGVDEKYDYLEREQLIEKIKGLEENIIKKTDNEDLWDKENVVMRKSKIVLEKYNIISECPCCGKNFQSNKSLLSLIEKRMKERMNFIRRWKDDIKNTRDEIKKLRKVDDISRELSLHKQQEEIISLAISELTTKISELSEASSSLENKRDGKSKRYEEVLNLIKAEERMINAELLRKKIETAKIDLSKLKESLSNIKSEMDEINLQLSELPSIEGIKNEIDKRINSINELNSTLLQKTAEKNELLEKSESFNGYIKELDDLNLDIGLLNAKIDVCNDFISNIYKNMERELIEIGKKSLTLGEVFNDLELRYISTKKSEIIRRISGEDFKQRLLSLSTGEKVLINIEAKAKNAVWKNGGFVIIDANLSDDVLEKCVNVLLEHGCEQVIFLMTETITKGTSLINIINIPSVSSS